MWGKSTNWEMLESFKSIYGFSLDSVYWVMNLRVWPDKADASHTALVESDSPDRLGVDSLDAGLIPYRAPDVSRLDAEKMMQMCSNGEMFNFYRSPHRFMPVTRQELIILPPSVPRDAFIKQGLCSTIEMRKSWHHFCRHM